MFFGMTNSPATFQSMMNDYLADMIAQGWVLIYINDILIFSKKPEDHHEWTTKVLKRLEEKDLFLKPEKCAFNAKEVEYLGFIVKPNEISMDPTKLAGIRHWIPPTNVKGVRSFLGSGNFYRRFIGNYAEIAKPQYLSLPHLFLPDSRSPVGFLLDSNKFSKKAFLHIYSTPPTGLLLDSNWT